MIILCIHSHVIVVSYPYVIHKFVYFSERVVYIFSGLMYAFRILTCVGTVVYWRREEDGVLLLRRFSCSVNDEEPLRYYTKDFLSRLIV